MDLTRQCEAIEQASRPRNSSALSNRATQPAHEDGRAQLPPELPPDTPYEDLLHGQGDAQHGPKLPYLNGQPMPCV